MDEGSEVEIAEAPLSPPICVAAWRAHGFWDANGANLEERIQPIGVGAPSSRFSSL